MAKDPAFLFYASDFLTGTMFLTDTQVGKYIRLLCSQHQHGGFIEKNAFNNLVGEDVILRAKFIETEHGFYNIRLSEEMESRNKKSSNISKAAKETWEKRKKNTIVLQSYKKSNKKVIRIEDEIENENKDKNINKNGVEKKIEFLPPIYPNQNDLSMELPEMKKQLAIQYFKSAKKIDVDIGTIDGLWEVFKGKHFNGKTPYNDENKIFTHFIDSLKFEKIEHGGTGKNIEKSISGNYQPTGKGGY